MNLYELLRKKKIVLIDDDQWVLDSLRTFLLHEGCVLKTFDSAAEAMETLARERFDIIICDYWLREMDGITLLKLVEGSQHGAIRLLITAFPRSDIYSPENRIAYDDFIQKPLTVRKLETSLEGLLAAGRGGGSAT